MSHAPLINVAKQLLMHRLLLSIDRRQSFQDANDTVELAVRYNQPSSSHCSVLGVDLSGDPMVSTLMQLVKL